MNYKVFALIKDNYSETIIAVGEYATEASATRAARENTNTMSAFCKSYGFTIHSDRTLTVEDVKEILKNN